MFLWDALAALCYVGAGGSGCHFVLEKPPFPCCDIAEISIYLGCSGHTVLTGAGSDHAGGTNLPREPLCEKEFLYVPVSVNPGGFSFFRWWDSSLQCWGS